MSDQELRAVILFDIIQERDRERRRAQRYEVIAILALILLAAVLGASWWFWQHPPINCPDLALAALLALRAAPGRRGPRARAAGSDLK